MEKMKTKGLKAKRLTLSKETLRDLGEKELSAVAGGTAGPRTPMCTTQDD